MQNLQVRKKSHMAYFRKNKNYRIHCCVAHIIKKTLFELFELLDAQNMCFGARLRFCLFFYVQKFIDVFTILEIFYKLL